LQKKIKKIDKLLQLNNFCHRASVNSNIFFWRIRLVKIVLKKHCPKCKDMHYERISRLPWMRLFKRSQLYQCNHCRTIFLVLFAKRHWKIQT